MRIQNGNVLFSMPEMNRTAVEQIPIYTDELSGAKYFFTKVPIEYLFHDERIARPSMKAVHSVFGQHALNIRQFDLGKGSSRRRRARPLMQF